MIECRSQCTRAENAIMLLFLCQFVCVFFLANIWLDSFTFSKKCIASTFIDFKCLSH